MLSIYSLMMQGKYLLWINILLLMLICLLVKIQVFIVAPNEDMIRLVLILIEAIT